MSGTDGKALTKKFNAETAVLRMLEQTNAREKHVPPALKALQAAKERSAAAAASMDKTSSNVKTLAGEWSALSIPPPTFKGDGSTSTLAENALPIMQSEVRALPDMMIVDPADQERIAKRLQDFKEKLRLRHVAAKDEYTQLRKTIFKELELEVSILGKGIKDKISGSEAEIESVVVGLSDAVRLVGMQLSDIDAQWHRIELEFEQRAAWIQQLEAQLNHIESRRSHLVGAELQRLIARLADIGHELPADLERLLNQESTEVNGHVLRNRASYAELIARLKVVAVQRLNDLKQVFAERKAAWRKLRHDRALARYFEQIRAKDYVSPPQRRKVFDELKRIQTVSHSQCMVKLRVLGEAAPPQLTVELTQKLSQHVTDLLAALGEVAEHAMAYLKRHQQEQREKGLAYVAAMRAQMAEAAFATEAEIDEIIQKECMPDIEQAFSWIGTLRERIDVALQAEERRIYQPALAVIEFFRQAAQLDTAFKTALDKVDEDVTEALNLRSDRYEDDKQQLERQLAALLRQLREAPDLEVLETRMQAVAELVGENGTIEKTHREFNRDSVQLAASHVPQLKRTLRDFQQRFSERFGLRARTGAALLAPSIHEQHTAGNDDAAAAAAVDESSEHKGDMSSAELASVLDDELSERVESDTGTVYLVKQDLPHLAYVLMTTLSEEEQKEADAKAAAEVAAKKKADEEAVATAAAAGSGSAPHTARGSAAAAAADPKVVQPPAPAPAAAAAAKKVDPKAGKGAPPPPPEPVPEPVPAESTPPPPPPKPFNDAFLPHDGDDESLGIKDTDGLPCLAVLYFDLNVAEAAAQQLRQAFLNRWDHVGGEMVQRAEQQNQKRQSDFARDINQVLRAHRPRIRRLDSDVFECRAVELSQNRGKFERHAQRVQTTAYTNNAAFHEEVAALEAALETYVTDLTNWQHQLHEATSAGAHVTAVQALQKKVKARHAEVSAAVRERSDKLQRLCQEQRAKAQTAETQFVESCRLLSDEVLAATAQYANIKAVISHSHQVTMRPSSSAARLGATSSSAEPSRPSSRSASRTGSRLGTARAGDAAGQSSGNTSLKNTSRGNNSTIKPEDAHIPDEPAQQDHAVTLSATSGGSGGTFNRDEVVAYHRLAAELTAQVDAVLNERNQQMADLKSKADATLDLRAFDQDFYAALEDLSVAQSLGHKYGAPKMKVTIRLREEFAASETAQTAMDEAWALLQRLCRPASALASTRRAAEPGNRATKTLTSSSSKPSSALGTSRKLQSVSFASSLPSSSSSSSSSRFASITEPEEDERESLTSRIIQVLDELRQGLYHRAIYLSCLQRILPRPSLSPVPALPISASSSSDDQPIENTLMSQSQLQMLQDVARLAAYSVHNVFQPPPADAPPVSAKGAPKKDDKKPAAAAAAAAAPPVAQNPIAAAALELYPSQYHALQNSQATALQLNPFFHVIADATATGRVEMAALYKAYWTQHGDRLRALGRVQTERPPLFDERMLSEEQRSKQVHGDALAAYRHLVEVLGDILHMVPKVCFNDILFRTQGAAARLSGHLRDMFQAQYASSQAQRKDHQRLLKPSLGAPDARPALEVLCAREADRSQSTRTSITLYRQHWLLSIRRFAERFLRRIAHASETLMSVFDTMPALCDLDTPQLESVAKRRGLKRAMREQTRKARADNSGTVNTPLDPSMPSAEGVRFLTKTWPGAVLSGFQFPELPLLSLQAEEAKAKAAQAEAEAAAAAAAAVAAPKDAKKAAAVPAMKKDTKSAIPAIDAALAADPSAPVEIATPPMTGFKILANREVIAQRDQAIAAYQAYFQTELAAAIESTLAADQEEEKWTQNWLRTVQLLKE